MPHSTTTAVNGTTAVPTKTVNNTTLPIAPLETISYASLLADDPQEKERLLKASQHPGFFYLDFENDDPQGVSRQIAKDLREAYAVSEKYFTEHEAADKMKDIEIRHDHLASPPNLPAPLQSSMPLITRLSNSMREANMHLLTKIHPELAAQHSPSAPSETALDLIYAPTKALEKDAPDTTHTDGGTFTILCSDSWGIKIEDPATKEWRFAEPRAGTGLVNVCDWLARESKKAGSEREVCSARHAVSQVGDGVVKRYYVVHYLRPALEQ